MNFFQKLYNKLFGIQYVIITDCSGSSKIRPVYSHNGYYYSGIYSVSLFEMLPDGKFAKDSYVEEWKPLTSEITKYYNSKDNKSNYRKLLKENEILLQVNKTLLTLLEEKEGLNKKSNQSYYTEEFQVLFPNNEISKEAIKKQYLYMSKKTHPDAGGSDEMFKKINQAYTKLIQ